MPSKAKDGEIDWRLVLDGPEENTKSRRTADANPVTQQANDALKIVKKLQDLLTDLAGMDQTSRDQIATAAGLQQLPEAIEKLYALSDQLRIGGTQQLQPAYANGWDPDKLRKIA